MNSFINPKLASHFVLVTLATALMTTNPAQARVGETQSEVNTRYGQGQICEIQRLLGAETFKYKMNNFQIEVVIHNGKSIWEIIQRQDRVITEEDIKELIKANTIPGGTWHFDRRDKRWERSGKPKLVGYLWPGHEDYFCIKDLEACEAIEKKNKAKTGGF